MIFHRTAITPLTSCRTSGVRFTIRIAPRFLDWQRATLPDDIFRQEYLCDFIADGEALLDPELIFRAIDPSIQPLFGGKRIFS